MSMAIRVHQAGGPEQMKWEAVSVPQPGAGEATVRHTAVGLNYIDVYHRTGLYPAGDAPFGIGLEAAGVVEAVGDEVSDVAVGDRVAYVAGPTGAYSESRNMAADRLIKLPDDVDPNIAAAVMLQGMTTQYLLRRTYRVEAGDTILIHAAAGGVGLLACQWAKHLGATVIGTVSTPAKADLAREHGCDHPILYTQENFVDAVRDLTGGAGVAAVYDSVGQNTIMGSLDCLSRLGTLVLFGQSSGPVPPFDLGLLAAKGSLFITRPTLFHYIESRDDLEATAGELLEMVSRGVLKVGINQTYALKDAAQAHQDLEARKTTGSTILLPD